MKRFKHIFRAFGVVLLIILTTTAKAQEISGLLSPNSPVGNHHVSPAEPAWLDSVDISLLTCGPGKEVWSYYGHTALRIEDHAHGNDLAINWGMFSFKQDYFVLRFVFGLTDYQIGIFPMSDFIAEYTAEGRWVLQQHLVLTRAEKWRIMQAIDKNYQDENRTYRYNFFFDNCTTRTRNMIVDNLGSHVTDFKNINMQSTYRSEIHRWNERHRWARFGNDLLLGYAADKPLNKEEWEFLPVNLCKDFATEARKDTALQSSVIETRLSGRNNIKLVDNNTYLVKPQAEISGTESITPRMALATIALVVLALSSVEFFGKKNFWWLDTVLLLATGLPGLILLAMVFSHHPTVQVNFQMLILNPLNLLFVWNISKKARRGGYHWYYNIWGGLLALSLFLQIWQNYAEGMVILALSLLIRYASRSAVYDLKIFNNKKK